jgi:hypothetical protein
MLDIRRSVRMPDISTVSPQSEALQLFEDSAAPLTP